MMSFLISPPTEENVLKLLTSNPTPLPMQLAANFREIDEAVTAAKNKLDPFEKDVRFSQVARILDPYVNLKWEIIHKFNGQAVTNAWLKMYEIIMQQGLFEICRPDGAAIFRVFCNAELPGAFVSALNHYACTWFPNIKFQWVASSLYPEVRKGILEDVYGIYRHNKTRWLMDAEMTGDVSDTTCVSELARRARAQLGEIDMYTSDVGIDVSDDFNRQEELTARLNFGQILTGLLSLRIGGGLVVKMYTFTQPFSLSLLVVCAALFDSFHVVKPKTSRPTNSEVYLIGTRFRGISDKIAEHLLGMLRDFDFNRALTSLECSEIQDTLLSLLIAAREIHLKQQVFYLTEEVEFFKIYVNKIPELKKFLHKCARATQKGWLDENQIIRLERKCFLVNDEVKN